VDPQVLRVLLVRLALRALLVPRVQLDHEDRLVRRVLRVPRVLRVRKVRLAFRALQVLVVLDRKVLPV